ncbi:MAG: glycosyltransferase family 2 protein [Oligoflexia bacterium]|nr:glycosyltransferase family 2 protein [Oligoflexia bacterium]
MTLFSRIYQASQSFARELIASEISRVSKYFQSTVQVSPLPHDSGELLSALVCPKKSTSNSIDELHSPPGSEATLFLLNGNINHDLDIQATLQSLKTKLARPSRIVLVGFNPYLRWLYLLLSRLGLRTATDPSTFVTRSALRNICSLSGYHLVRERPLCAFPLWIPVLSRLINRAIQIVPGLRWAGLAYVALLRPIIRSTDQPSISIIVPARNEKGNVQAIFERTPALAPVTELIIVEGNSNDGTWEELQLLYPNYASKFPIKLLKQTGRGKSDAVRLALKHARNELMVILDADLSVPPELLSRFYEAYCNGLADFINGNRLVYPIEGQAMRFLNKLGNIFFAKALAWVLDAPIGDSLCGTKMVSMRDIRRFEAWRSEFGDFDPFGDFELLFPAAILGLGIIDIPIRYRDRVYGTTNISRFRHGLMLFRMTLVGLLRIKA